MYRQESRAIHTRERQNKSYVAVAGINIGGSNTNIAGHQDRSSNHQVKSQGEFQTPNPSVPNTPEDGQTSIKPFQDQEDSSHKCLPIKELLKQAFREEMNDIVKENVYNLWSYMDKTKIKKKINIKEGKKLQHCTAEDPYVVEFPDDDEEMLNPSNEQDQQGIYEDALAREISFNLQIKRKRDETCQFLLEDGTEADSNINNMQIVLKQQKLDAGGKWAEEAGLNKPHYKP
ncbi:hypothetical protein PIB30_066988 [Stylosanthes scabra]|uniref:Uncharacterized protein n=1 Tax=Stylosanthes scabra TaxID=79078 RepID=A0ABU6RMN3_9FABA|nr:hypothetical protein [Stylosanthes scabra]